MQDGSSSDPGKGPDQGGVVVSAGSIGIRAEPTLQAESQEDWPFSFYSSEVGSFSFEGGLTGTVSIRLVLASTRRTLLLPVSAI